MPMLVPMEAPFRMPVMLELPPRWQEITRKGGPAILVAPLLT